MSDWTPDVSSVFLTRAEAIRFLDVSPSWFDLQRPLTAGRTIRKKGRGMGPGLFKLEDLLPLLAHARARL